MIQKKGYALISGVIFALGLGVSGMTRPEKVIGFLDLFGNWDPSLMFVMMGAIGLHFFLYKVIRKRQAPRFEQRWHVPTNTQLTPQLIIGAILFGAGWALAGLCPGPALVSLLSFDPRILFFVGSMLAGVFLYRFLQRKNLF